MQDPSQAKGMIDRSVTRIITGGTITDPESLGVYFYEVAQFRIGGDESYRGVVACFAEFAKDRCDTLDRSRYRFEFGRYGRIPYGNRGRILRYAREPIIFDASSLDISNCALISLSMRCCLVL